VRDPFLLVFIALEIEIPAFNAGRGFAAVDESLGQVNGRLTGLRARQCTLQDTSLAKNVRSLGMRCLMLVFTGWELVEFIWFWLARVVYHLVPAVGEQE
jgi:hypothetical protein